MKDAQSPEVREFSDLIMTLIISLDPAGKITLINKACCEVLGYKKDELIGKNWFETCLPKEKREEVKIIFNGLISGKLKEYGHAENQVITKGKKIRIIAWHNAVLKEDRGKIIGTLSAGEDVTGKKRAEEELKESEEKYKAIFEGAAEGIIVADAEKKNFISANKKIQEMLGYSGKEILELGIMGIHPKKDLPLVMEKFKEQQEGKITTAENLPVLRKDGKVIYCDITSSQVIIGGRKIMLGFFKDVTRRRKTEEELKERAEELEKFNQFAVGRELKMVELKKEVNALLNQRGQPQRYQTN